MRPAGQGPETGRRRVGRHRPPAATRAPWASSPQKDQQWTLARLTDAGRARMADVAKDHTEPWQGLGVSILHRLLVENLLAGAKLPKPKYVHLVEEVVAGLRHGRVPAGRVGHARHGRRHSHDQFQRRADAGQEHVFLSEAFERPGHQSAGVRGEKAEGGGRKGEGGRRLATPRPPAASGGNGERAWVVAGAVPRGTGGGAATSASRRVYPGGFVAAAPGVLLPEKRPT